MTDFGRRVEAEPAANVLPKTGQEIVYRAGDDGDYEAGWEGDRFTDNGDGTITDNATSLMWPKDVSGLGGNSGVTLIWNDAIDWAEGLDFAGYSDWRLSNIHEIWTLMDLSTKWPSAYSVFDNIFTQQFSTSTTYHLSTAKIYCVMFWIGDLFQDYKTNKSNVWAVRTP